MEVFVRNYCSEKDCLSVQIILDHKSIRFKNKWKTFTKILITKSHKTLSWIIFDTQLVRHTGLPMYHAFYHLSLNAKIKKSDFDQKVINQKVDPIELNLAINRIRQSRQSFIQKIDNVQVQSTSFFQDPYPLDQTNPKLMTGKSNNLGEYGSEATSSIVYGSDQYLKEWRETKATLAGAIVIINKIDWYFHQLDSCQITRQSDNLVEYLDRSLHFSIEKSWRNIGSFRDEILKMFERQKCFYPSDLKIRICLGVDIISNQIDDQNDFNLTDDSQWWEWGLIILIFVIILAVILWILIRQISSI